MLKTRRNYKKRGPVQSKKISYDGINFGLVEIDWGNKPSPLIKLVALSSVGDLVFNYTVSLSQLRQH